MVALALPGFLKDITKKEVENQVYPLSELKTSQINYEIQIQKIFRVDNSENFCGRTAIVLKTNENFCVCKNSDKFEIPRSPHAKTKVFLENLKKDLFFVIGDENTNCIDTCKISSRFCEESGLEVANNYDLLYES